MNKQEFDDRLKQIGLSRTEFSSMTNIAYSTIGNWHDAKSPVPGWVDSWLDNYEKAKELDSILQLIKKFAK